MPLGIGIGNAIQWIAGVAANSAIGFEGLLDTYSGAAAAYSVRLLSSTYTGALVRIRRSSDNAEKDFYPDSNNELSLSSEDGAGTSLSSWIGANNGFVATWYDQSGNSGRDAIQASAASQPQIITAGALLTQNSKVSLNFNGANNLSIGTTSTFNFLHDGTSSCAITVANLSTTSSLLGTAALSRALRGYSTRVRTNDTIQVIISTGSAFAVNNITDSASFTAGQLALIQDYIDADNATAADRSSIYLDNSAVYKNNTETNSVSASDAVNSMRLGAFGDLSGYLNGYMSECIFYDSDQTSNKNGIQTNINEYFSIY